MALELHFHLMDWTFPFQLSENKFASGQNMATRQITITFIDGPQKKISGVSGIGCEGQFLIVETPSHGRTTIFPAHRILDAELMPETK